MESNQMTCPQCGLANNPLAEECAQCGIIFVKNNDAPMQSEEDEQKRKAIEEAEAILEQSDPAAKDEPAAKETVTRPDPADDTIEMAIPVEQPVAETPSEAPPANDKQQEEQPDVGTAEIELEAIETSIEMVTTDAEELFLSEVEPHKPSPAATEKAAESASPPETTVASNDKMMKSDGVAEEKKEDKQEDLDLKQMKAEPAATVQPKEDPLANESGEAQSEVALPEKAGASDSADTKTPTAEIAEPATTHDKPKAAAGPPEKEINIEEKPEASPAKEESDQNKAPAQPEVTIEMPKELAEKTVPKKGEKSEAKDQIPMEKQEIQVKEALQNQRENKAKADALKKQRAAKAKAAALKKQKLARVKAEALKKQKAAQARAEAAKNNKTQAKAKPGDTKKSTRAEALKKQKEAQAKAEASTQDIEIASSGVSEIESQAADASLSHHMKLLGLLKKYKGKAIGINYDNSSEIKAAELVDANEEFFSVRVKDKKLQYSYPLKNILTIVEGQEGVETGEDDQKIKFDAVIKVYPLAAF